LGVVRDFVTEHLHDAFAVAVLDESGQDSSVTGHDPPVEDQRHLVRPTQVQVVADRRLEQRPASARGVDTAVSENSGWRNEKSQPNPRSNDYASSRSQANIDAPSSLSKRSAGHGRRGGPAYG